MVAERAYRNVAGYGPLEPLLVDDDVWAIMVNGPDATFDESPDKAPRSLSTGLDRPHREKARGWATKA